MPDNECDPACIKTIIDTGMAVFAMRAYARVIGECPGLRSINYFAPQFFIDAVMGDRGAVAGCDCEGATPALSGFYQVAQWLNRKKLTTEQRAILAAQVNKDCYRSDDLLAWAQKSEAEILAHVATWTREILAWVKDDQTVYTALVADVG